MCMPMHSSLAQQLHVIAMHAGTHMEHPQDHMIVPMLHICKTKAQRMQTAQTNPLGIPRASHSPSHSLSLSLSLSFSPFLCAACALSLSLSCSLSRSLSPSRARSLSRAYKYVCVSARHARIRKSRIGVGEKFRMSAKVTECARAARPFALVLNPQRPYGI